MRRQIARIHKAQADENNLESELRKDRDNDLFDTTIDTSDDSDTSDIVQNEDV